MSWVLRALFASFFLFFLVSAMSHESLCVSQRRKRKSEKDDGLADNGAPVVLRRVPTNYSKVFSSSLFCMVDAPTIFYWLLYFRLLCALST